MNRRFEHGPIGNWFPYLFPVVGTDTLSLKRAQIPKVPETESIGKTFAVRLRFQRLATQDSRREFYDTFFGNSENGEVAI